MGAGMGSDLFGSFAEASCAALVISASSPEIVSVGSSAFMFPLMISAVGIVMCMLTSFVATHIQPVQGEKDVEKVLKVQLFTSASLMTIATLPLALCCLPDTFTFVDLYEINTDEVPDYSHCTAWGAWICVVCGLWGGCLIGFITEYYTSHSYRPVQEVAESCESGAATNIIYGLALGYLSCIIPIVLLSINVFVSFQLCGMYGVSLAALGMLGTLCTCLSIDVYGPIADNAGGLAEMAEFPSFVRDKTDALDAAGNTTAAIGKGFAIGSAALVSLALFGGFVSRLAAHSYGGKEVTINVLRPITFSFLFLAAMLVMLSPIITGALFGVEAVSGLLVGSLISAVQLAISQSNSGGAWDNAKKYVESGKVSVMMMITDDFAEQNPTMKIEENGTQMEVQSDQYINQEINVVQGKKTELHKSAVTGDTVGDPLKDTSGPALNIVMKLMAILSLVFSDFFVSINNGRGLFNVPSSLDLSCTSDGQCVH